MPETTVEIFSDGACSGNPGPGGYGAILRWNGKEKELSGGEKHTTNNRMELTGVIEALTALKYPCKVILTTDSKYVVDSVKKDVEFRWIKGHAGHPENERCDRLAVKMRDYYSAL